MAKNYQDDELKILNKVYLSESIADSSASEANVEAASAAPAESTLQPSTDTDLENDSVSVYNGGKWNEKADKALEEYNGFTYEDYLASPEYKELEEQYSEAGQESMQNTLGEISARTGGIASSYASVAAQSDYDQFMRTLFQTANEMYDSRRDEMLKEYDMYRALAEDDYDKYSAYLDLAYSQSSKEASLAQKQVDSLIAQGKMPTPELIARSGYSEDYVNESVNSVREQQAAEAAAKAESDSGKGNAESNGESSTHPSGDKKSEYYDTVRDAALNGDLSPAERARYIAKQYYESLITAPEMESLLDEVGAKVVSIGDNHNENNLPESFYYVTLFDRLKDMEENQGATREELECEIKIWFMARLIYSHEADMLMNEFL